MSEPIYRSKVRIEKLAGPHRKAWIAPFGEPFEYGVHGGIAEAYGVEPEEPFPTTLDHVVSAAVG